MPLSSCMRCGQPFGCGESAMTPCWCASLPPVLPLAAGASCLCPSCLRDSVQEAVTAWMKDHPLPEPVPESYRSTELVEDVDYYWENGLSVFTEWFHRKRGACCGNGCRHCPWRVQSDSSVVVS